MTRQFPFLIMALCLMACEQPSLTQQSDNAEQEKSAQQSTANVTDVDWRLHGNDFGEQRYSELSQINTDNVDQLGLEWSFDMYTRRGVEATPLVIGHTLYATSSWSVVYALDAVTGDKKWVYDPKVDRAFLAKGCCDAVNRGVAYADGKIFVGAYDGRLIALHADSGDLVWEVQTTDREQSYTITGAPRIAKDKVIIGNGGAELGVRGYVTAYDINSGNEVWRFYTVPGNPADDFENDSMEMAAQTWTGEWWKWGGGGTVWDSMVYDPELDLFYIGVGNGSPWNSKLRSPEGGDNLFLASIVALKPDTGEYVWHYQTTPEETWDFTATQHMMLADIEIEGETRKVLMQAPKNGFFYVLDRQTGELISAEKYTQVNWASHVDMATGRPIETENARLFDGKNISLPSNAGGHNWPPMAYNVATGLVYIPTMVIPITFKDPTHEDDSKPGQGKWNVGFDRSANIPPDIPEEQLAAFLDSAVSGQLVAWDPKTQSARWATQPGRPSAGGALSTAGGLVFQADGFGFLTAYNAANGEKLWSHDTQTAAMAPPVTYRIDGEQYIAVAVGFGGGLASEAGGLAYAWEFVNRSRVLVYKLGGNHQLPTAEDIAKPELVKPEPVTASDAVVAEGERLYHRHCGYCHGDAMRTGGVTKDIRRATPAIHKLWQEIIRGGIFSGVGMVSFKDQLSEQEAEAIRQYALREANKLYVEMVESKPQ